MEDVIALEHAYERAHQIAAQELVETYDRLLESDMTVARDCGQIIVQAFENAEVFAQMQGKSQESAQMAKACSGISQ